MSTEHRSPLGRGVGFVTDLLEHPLFGTEVRRTRYALAFLAGLAALVLASHAGTVITVGGAPLETTTWLFDTLSAIIIVGVVAAITVVPIAYAGWNGGPAMAFAIPLVPVALGELIAGRYVLGLDMAIALTVGAVGAAVALYATDVRQTRRFRPWRAGSIDDDLLVFVTTVSLVASLSAVSFVRTVPDHVLELYTPFLVLWLVPAVIVCTYWGVWTRVALEAGRDRRPLES
ncbi:hypothetical protein OB955_04370 [Halobacteria archaeon AArc-m2/3/4]|uniref:Uncharacterized protein n=1 Tax=Natronoglomus mannanivorans TaxID=2979990 RepID=A0AAP2Z0N7_9EURY|nr:hypothetical protein [Halobacteria archaeon AArc-xg1-1]MCU4971971.1 hypothetical protein [Halobacteria archaeon AArc-m2/3/4]